jgi:hypothetical protein
MSKFYSTADAIAARLEADDALAGVAVVVDRQRDLDAELKKAVGMQKGKGLLVVTWIGGTNFDEMKETPHVSANFTVTGFFKPVLRANDTPADDIIEAVCKSLHDWKQDSADHFHSRLVAKTIDPIQHPELLAMRVSISAQLIL